MHVRRGLGVLTVVTTLLSGVSPVYAQVDEAERRADDAAARADAAYAIVADAVADRDAIEAALFVALEEYQHAATELSEGGIRLQQLTESLAFADAEALNAAAQLESHTITAYMEAVSSTASVVLDTDTIEDAIFVGQIVRESQADALATLGHLITQRNELERIRAEHTIGLVQVETLERDLAARASELQDLFATANFAVAEAFSIAATADAAHRAALDDIDRALAEDEAARRALEVATTTTTPTTAPAAVTTTTAPAPTTTGSGPTTTTSAPTTTVATDASWPPIPINDRVMAWRSLLEQHFAADLILDALVIIQCESRGYEDIVNPYSGASGLFQFMPGTWAVASVQAGVGDRSVFDGEANIIAASWLAEYYRARIGEPWRPWSCRAHL